MITPPRLKSGSTIVVLPLSKSMKRETYEECLYRERISQNAAALWRNFVFPEINRNIGILDAAPTLEVVDAFHEAIESPHINGVLSLKGWRNANRLLPYLDFELIKNHPKVIMGYSDITTLLNAITHKTGLVTYHGPMALDFGAQDFSYSHNYCKLALMSSDGYEIKPSPTYAADNRRNGGFDKPTIDQARNPGRMRINPWKASGKIIWGNLVSLNMLQGSEFMPSLDWAIVVLEDIDEDLNAVARSLQSLAFQKGSQRISGIVFGRFDPMSDISLGEINLLIQSISEFRSIPVVAHVDFGHTRPQAVIPIGAHCHLDSSLNSIIIG